MSARLSEPVGTGPHEVTCHWASPPLGGAGDQAAVWAAQQLQLWDDVAPAGPRTGLYVASPDSGSREALSFWQAAHETGLALASPRDFPWTLSTSLAGRVAQALGVTGPCTTWVGGEEATAEAEETARLDLADGLVDVAVVIAVQGDEPPVALGPGPAAGGAHAAGGTGEVRLRLAARVLRRATTPAPSGEGRDRA